MNKNKYQVKKKTKKIIQDFIIIFNKEMSIEDKPSSSVPIATEINQSKSVPPPLRKTTSTINTNPYVYTFLEVLTKTSIFLF